MTRAVPTEQNRKPTPMAIYHLSVKPVSRSAGRSATAAAAYRAGCSITDERTGETHDYRRKGGVESADIVLPDGAPEWAADRVQLWNAAELAEKRKDACVAREFEVALPSELSPAERRRLALDFAKDMANREGCAVDVAIHAPGKEGDNRNHHAHILRTTRKVDVNGMGAKLDTEKAGRKRADDLAAARAKWAEMTNERLRENGVAVRVDHRSLQAQGIDREPTKHLGPAASGYERRTGQPSRNRIQQERDALERLIRAKALGELERQTDRLILDLSGDLAAAKAARDRPPVRATGIDPRSRYHPDNVAKRAQQEVTPVPPEKPLELVKPIPRPTPAVAPESPPKRQYDPVADAAQAAARQEEAREAVNRQAVARGITDMVAFPPGTSGQFTAAHFSSFETALDRAERALKFHKPDTPRPEKGLFGGTKRQQAWDEQQAAERAALEAKVQRVAEAIQWRDKALKSTMQALQSRDAAQIAEHAQLAQDFAKQKQLTPEKTKPIERGRGPGISR